MGCFKNYDTDESELENKIPDTSGLVKKTDYNIKITDIESKISDVSNWVNKTDYITKVAEIENKLNNYNHNKYIDTSEFNKLAADAFNPRIARANLITKTDFDAKLSSLKKN